MLKSLLFSLALLTTTSTALADDDAPVGRYRTVAGHPACRSNEWLSDFYRFWAAKDTESGQAYLDIHKCTMLKGGILVTLAGSHGFFGSTVSFYFKGLTLWAPREAIEAIR